MLESLTQTQLQQNPVLGPSQGAAYFRRMLGSQHRLGTADLYGTSVQAGVLLKLTMSSKVSLCYL